MPSPPPPPMSSTLHKSCSSPSPSPPPPKLQRAPDSRHSKPICTCLDVTIRPPSPRCARVCLINSRVPSRNRAGGGACRLSVTRRAHAASLLLLSLAAVSAPPPVRAEEEGVLGAIKSILDPNEKTKAGKTLPKAYLKAAREVVRTLRESLEEDDGGDMARFRRNADAAKESIREFLGGWRGQQAVAAEESYVALEKAIRSLAEFYSKAGPSAPLPQDVKNKILDDLSTADAYL